MKLEHLNSKQSARRMAFGLQQDLVAELETDVSVSWDDWRPKESKGDRDRGYKLSGVYKGLYFDAWVWPAHIAIRGHEAAAVFVSTVPGASNDDDYVNVSIKPSGEVDSQCIISFIKIRRERLCVY